MDGRSRGHLTWNEYQQLPDDGIRYEIIDGKLMMTPTPDVGHQTATVNLIYHFESWRRASGERQGGMFFGAPVDVVLAVDAIVQPDMMYVRPARVLTLIREQIQGAPDLVVEIFRQEQSERDKVTKLQLYARHRVPEYWLVDLDARTVTVLRIGTSGYDVLVSAAGDAPVTSQVLPGLSLTAAQVFDASDRSGSGHRRSHSHARFHGSFPPRANIVTGSD